MCVLQLSTNAEVGGDVVDAADDVSTFECLAAAGTYADVIAANDVPVGDSRTVADDSCLFR